VVILTGDNVTTDDGAATHGRRRGDVRTTDQRARDVVDEETRT